MKKITKTLITSIFIFLFVTITNCKTAEEPVEEPVPFTLSIIHTNDTHSQIDAVPYTLTIGGEPTQVQLGGFPQMVEIIKSEESTLPNPLLIHAGDAITGSVYYSLFQGSSDSTMMNNIEWDAYILGNHDFDGGEEILGNYLNTLQAPVLAANIQSSGSLASKLKPYSIVIMDEEKVGIIGIAAESKTKQFSKVSENIKFLGMTSTTQKYIDELITQEINKIIVVAHIGFQESKKLASNLEGVDIIISADSHALFGKNTLRNNKLPIMSDYPTMAQSKSKEPVAILEAWEYTKGIAKSTIVFSPEGIVQKVEGTPLVIFSDSFQRNDANGKPIEITNEERQTIYAEIEQNPAFVLAQGDPTALQQAQKIKEEKEEAGKEVIGRVLNFIPGGAERDVPKESKDKLSKWGNFSAQTVAEVIFQSLKELGTGDIDIVIQNAGRSIMSLEEGDIYVDTVYALLPYSDKIHIATISGEEIVKALEDGVDHAISATGNSGAFPYAAGLQYTVNLLAPIGTRVSKVQVLQNDEWVAIDNDTMYNVGINSHIAKGRDGFHAFEALVKSNPDNMVNTSHLDAQLFIDYMRNKGSISRPKQTSVHLNSKPIVKEQPKPKENLGNLK